MARSSRIVLALAAGLGLVIYPVRGDDGPVELIPGDLDAWRAPHGQWSFVESVALRPDNEKLLVGEGEVGRILLNGPIGRTGNLVTEESFGDVELTVEFVVPRGSNSGVKLHGHYEVQIADSWGKEEVKASDCGGLYPRAELLPRYRYLDEGYPPKLNACRPPGEWQTLRIIFHAPRFDAEGRKTADARFVLVELNGQVVHEDQDLPYPTGHAWRNREVAEGPILLQGDHGPVAFRNLKVRPIADEPDK